MGEPQLPGRRIHQPPSRRQLAQTLQQAIPVVNAHSENMDALHRELGAIGKDLSTHLTMSRWARLRWVLGL